MHTKQTIIIIGAASEQGRFIAKSLLRGNYRLLLNDKNEAKLSELLGEVDERNLHADVEAIDCSFEGCWEADIIICAVPQNEEKEVAERIREVANQKIVISFNAIPEVKNEELQVLLPNSKVVNVAIRTFGLNPQPTNPHPDAFISGKDVEALQTVAELLTTAGSTVVVKDGAIEIKTN